MRRDTQHLVHIQNAIVTGTVVAALAAGACSNWCAAECYQFVDIKSVPALPPGHITLTGLEALAPMRNYLALGNMYGAATRARHVRIISPGVRAARLMF